MLGDMATSVGHESIVSWQPHGQAFRVHMPEEFASTIMPRYFMKQTKYKSFMRQLHLYGFHRICKGKDRGAYFHSMFIRNKKAMSLRMTRQNLKGKNSSKPTNRYAAGHHPDFYSLFETTITVDNDQEYEAKRSFTRSGLQSNPRMVRACTTAEEEEEEKKGFYLHGQATACAYAGSIDRHAGSIDEEKPSLLTRAFRFNQAPAGAAGVPPPVSYQWNSGSEAIIDLAVECLELCEEDENNRNADAGSFFGKRFFHVAETENYR
jgi:hypothetical protein